MKNDVFAADDEPMTVGDIVREGRGEISSDTVRRDIDRGLLPARRTPGGQRITTKRAAKRYLAERLSA